VVGEPVAGLEIDKKSYFRWITRQFLKKDGDKKTENFPKV